MFEPVKAGFGRYMARFYADLIATTRPLEEFVTRGAGKAIMWAPGRMVDAAEEMLSLYARDNIEPGPTKPFSMPIIFVAMAKDYVPSGRDFTRLQPAQRITRHDHQEESTSVSTYVRLTRPPLPIHRA